MQTRVRLEFKPRCPGCQGWLGELLVETIQQDGLVVQVAVCPLCRSIIGVSLGGAGPGRFVPN